MLAFLGVLMVGVLGMAVSLGISLYKESRDDNDE